MSEKSKVRTFIDSPRTKHFFCGSTGGACATFLLYPLDLLKTRMQVNRTVSSSWIKPFVKTVQDVYTREGLKAFYQGITPGLIGSVVSWGCYFLLFENAKARYRRWTNKNQLSIGYNFASSVESGVVTTVLTAPIWVIKTRMQLQQKLLTSLSPLLDCVYTIVRKEGFHALFTGLVPSLFLVSHGIIQFTAYEECKYFERYMGIEDVNTGFYGFINGGISKSIASLLTYPLQVARSRLQQVNGKNMYSGFLNCLKECYVHEGIRGLYSGFIPNILRTIPNSSVIFMTYEMMSRFYDTVLAF